MALFDLAGGVLTIWAMVNVWRCLAIQPEDQPRKYTAFQMNVEGTLFKDWSGVVKTYPSSWIRSAVQTDYSNVM